MLTPLLPLIGDRAHWLISPDASLWLVPWAALPLPSGSYVIEQHRLGYLISGRDLVAVRSREQPGDSLVLADPDFDSEPGSSVRDGGSERSALDPSHSSLGLVVADWQRLPGSAAEAEAIRPFLTRYLKASPRIFTGDKARESVCKANRRPRVLVLSTHGYFFEDDERPSIEKSKSAARVAAEDNPFLRCGLVLAGANRRERVKGNTMDDGLLTGLEILEMDLRGTELVVLSACDTGVCTVQNGEGVAGLRQAFQLAGAESVVASLWKVPDAETAQLMGRFWEALAERPDRAEALRDAQLALIQARRAGKAHAAHPYFWAAFTLTGQWRPENYTAPPRPLSAASAPPGSSSTQRDTPQARPISSEAESLTPTTPRATDTSETATTPMTPETENNQTMPLAASPRSEMVAWLPYAVGSLITALVLICGVFSQRFGRAGT